MHEDSWNYNKFSHLVYDVNELSKAGDNRIKHNLIAIGRELGNVTFDEMC